MIRRILLVDDDVDIRTIANLALTEVGGWDVTVAASAAEALAVLEAAAPDLILMDVAMPGMDGRAALAALRATPTGADVPVIFVTADASRGAVQRSLAAGACGVIAKPFDPLELPDKVRQIAAAAAAAAAATRAGRDG